MSGAVGAGIVFAMFEIVFVDVEQGFVTETTKAFEAKADPPEGVTSTVIADSENSRLRSGMFKFVVAAAMLSFEPP